MVKAKERGLGFLGFLKNKFWNSQKDLINRKVQIAWKAHIRSVRPASFVKRLTNLAVVSNCTNRRCMRTGRPESKTPLNVAKITFCAI